MGDSLERRHVAKRRGLGEAGSPKVLVRSRFNRSLNLVKSLICQLRFAKNSSAYSVETKSSETFHFGNSWLGGFAIVAADRGHAGHRGHVCDFGHVDGGAAEGA
jgi:hypothetical protein